MSTSTFGSGRVAVQAALFGSLMIGLPFLSRMMAPPFADGQCAVSPTPISPPHRAHHLHFHGEWNYTIAQSSYR
jgi:hypothetical protein